MVARGFSADGCNMSGGRIEGWGFAAQTLAELLAREEARNGICMYMYICIYVYMYLCIYIYVYTCI